MKFKNGLTHFVNVELQRALKKLGPLNEEQTEALESLTASLTNKLTQSSFAELRQLANQPDGFEKIELIRKLLIVELLTAKAQRTRRKIDFISRFGPRG